jgi:phosphoserine phosphatase RsbU/P
MQQPFRSRNKLPIPPRALSAPSLRDAPLAVRLERIRLFARTVAMKVKPGMAGGFATMMEAEILPALLREAGCQDAQMLLAPGGRQAIGLSLWGHRDDAEHHGRTSAESILDRLAGFLDEVSAPEVFQVWSSMRQAQTAIHLDRRPSREGRRGGRFRGESAAQRSQRHRIEMELGREVQRRLYPRNELQLPGCDAAGAVVPAEVMCGDYYDHFPLADGSLGIAIGDVSGHGIGPSLIMVQTRAYLRSFAQACPTLSEAMQRLNEALVSDLSSERFVTLLLLRLDLPNGRLSYANAGHLPGYLLDSQGEVRARLSSTGMPLGLFSGRSFEAALPLAVEKGDMIVLLTDGITESCAAGGQEFGAQGALEFVKTHRDLPAREIAFGLTQAARSFASHAQEDDMSVFVCKLV